MPLQFPASPSCVRQIRLYSSSFSSPYSGLSPSPTIAPRMPPSKSPGGPRIAPPVNAPMLPQPQRLPLRNGESTPYDRIDTCYDGLGRKSRVSIHINLVQRVPPVVRAHLREIATLTTL